MKKVYHEPSIVITNTSDDVFMNASFEISFDAFSDIFGDGDSNA